MLKILKKNHYIRVCRSVARIMEKHRHKLFRRGQGPSVKGGPWGEAPGRSRVIQQKG